MSDLSPFQKSPRLKALSSTMRSRGGGAVLRGGGLIIALSLFSWSHASPPSFAQKAHVFNHLSDQASDQTSNHTPDQIVFWEGFEPPGDDAPQETSGAGSRDGGACTASEPSIRALVPDSGFGLTQAERPTVFAQVPATSAQQVALIVTDEAGNYYERAFLPIATQDDVAAFTFPSEFAPLSVGTNYRWSVVVVCGETVQPDDPVLSGWIQRSDTDVLQMNGRSPLNQAQWYAQNGYWYDMLSVLRTEVRSHPRDIQAQALWQSVVNKLPQP